MKHGQRRARPRRWASAAPRPAADPALGPEILLVVLDGARALRALPGMPQVLARAPQAGVYTLCLDETQRLLPEECATVVAGIADGPAGLRCRARPGHPRRDARRPGGVGLVPTGSPGRWPRSAT